MPDVNIEQRVLAGVVRPRLMAIITCLFLLSDFTSTSLFFEEVAQEEYHWPLRMQDILKSHFKKENSSLPGNRWFALLLGLVQNFYEKEHQCPEMPTHKKDLFFFFQLFKYFYNRYQRYGRLHKIYLQSCRVYL